ncbi:hypothetical protein BKA56DRAFT_600607 [Ilyonectria sp. MPI-CAGE-AT-0026]|nr:hypothetical protein BKA56DRAFT_600607 [Ilyonectria sp. MPI-CAGE-AT-0026]
MELRQNFQFNAFASDENGADGHDLPDDVDWSNPESFFRALGGPMPKQYSPTEVRQEARKNSHKVFADYTTLSKILERHEATIQKRWTKKTRQQRLQILLNAWPGMPASHRPDFEAFRKESKEQRERSTRYEDHFMWPYVNQEDLSQTKLMPMLLNARGRHTPPDFAAADNAWMHLGLVTKAIVPIFLNEHTMVLHGATTADEYGKLVAWDSHPDAFDWMHTRKQFLPGEGLLVLKIQARLMSFLVDCCHQLLHDIPTSSLISDAYAVQPEPQLKTDTDASGFASLATMAAEAPYRLPARLDFGRLESLLEAKKSAAEDHAWALREDPAYYTEQFRETKDHRQEMLKDTEGRAHPVTNRLRENTLWARIIGSIAIDSYLSLESFTELHRQARNLRILQQKYKSEISPANDLPEDYLVALLRFRYFLEQTVKGSLNQLKLTVVSSPPMRKFFARNTPTDVNSTKISIVRRSEVDMNKVEQHLIWLLRTLWEDSRDLFLARLPDVVDELERLLQTDSHADALISAHVLRILGDLSIVAQCSKQLELYQPWAQNFENASVDWDEDFKKGFADWGKPYTQLMHAFREQNLVGAAKLGEPFPGKFTYPFGKHRSKETVDALRRAESNLDIFWAKLDEVMHTKGPNLGGTALQRLLSQPRILRRTAEWVEPEPTATKKTVDPAFDPDIHALNRPLSNLFLGLPETGHQGSSASKVQSKIKPKTRGVASKTQDDATTTPEDVGFTTHDSQPTFSVDARALKVFRTLFFNPEVTSTPGSIPWKDFLHAMVSTGFAVEKLYGSVWQFSPTKLDVQRGIHFHEPHPSGKIPFEVARRHGRRLTRAYGWFGAMFVLRK